MPIRLRSLLAEEFARNREEFKRNREEFKRNREFYARLDRDSRDREIAMRQFIRRTERVMENLVRITDDLRDETHAQTQATLRILDKLDERLPPPDTAGA